MKDLEIIKWLNELEPESVQQEIRIKKAIKCLDNSNVRLYINNKTIKDFKGWLTRAKYDDYLSWCKENSLSPESKVKFSLVINEEFGLIITSSWHYRKTEKFYETR